MPRCRITSYNVCYTKLLRRPAALRKWNRVAEVVGMSVGDQDGVDSQCVDRENGYGVAAQKRVDDDGILAVIEGKTGMSQPGDSYNFV